MHIHVVTWFSRGSVFPATLTFCCWGRAAFCFKGVFLGEELSVCEDSPAPPSPPPLPSSCPWGAAQPTAGESWEEAWRDPALSPRPAQFCCSGSENTPAHTYEPNQLDLLRYQLGQSVRWGFSLLFALLSYFSVSS